MCANSVAVVAPSREGQQQQQQHAAAAGGGGGSAGVQAARMRKLQQLFNR